MAVRAAGDVNGPEPGIAAADMGAREAPRRNDRVSVRCAESTMELHSVVGRRRQATCAAAKSFGDSMLGFALGACSGRTIGSNRAPVEGSGGAHADASVSSASTGVLGGSSGSRTDASVAPGATASQLGGPGGTFGGPGTTDGSGALGCDPLSKCPPLDCPPERQELPGPGRCCPACIPCGTGPCPPIAGPQCPLGQGIGLPPGQCCLACIPIPPGVNSGLDALHDGLGASLGAFSCNTADDCTPPRKILVRHRSEIRFQHLREVSRIADGIGGFRLFRRPLEPRLEPR